MRPFLTTVGVLAWIWALGVLWVFAESGGALTVIAAGIFAILAVLALACERILKTLEDIRDRRFSALPTKSGIKADEVPARPTAGVPLTG